MNQTSRPTSSVASVASLASLIRPLLVIGLLWPLAARSQEHPGLDELAWLAGHWRSEQEGAVTEELWTAPGGGLLLGINRQLSPGRRASFEYLRIEVAPEGVRYMASPGGGPPTAFPLARTGKQQVAFENPEHDWPQVIEYHLDDSGVLHVRAAGLEQGSQEIAWAMERVDPD